MRGERNREGREKGEGEKKMRGKGEKEMRGGKREMIWGEGG